ncbi:MAG: FadR family transcriptional regulator [Chloroflexi bacterium]|nr:FadR family transcriptional regulator [Chloroflexota bacterium]MCI0648799.1 FadR family transcriptional regulator [Chloroflexota bacterium]MCI0726301.1 FadR family transcriptional regulator [Chloroflexota bacterium]
MTNLPTDFGTVERAALPDQIAGRILQMIKDRQLKPGDKLPPERDLAATMGVGRPALREALRALALMNVIEVRQGAGAYVTELDTAQLVQHLDFVFALGDAAILDLFDARKIVEVGIIELAAQRITDEEIARLEQCLQKSIESAHDPELFLQADLELHTLIATIARNPILRRFIESIHQLGLASRRRTGRLGGVIEQSIIDHHHIVEALKARDPQAAREAMLSHLGNVEEKLKRLVEGGEKSEKEE